MPRSNFLRGTGSEPDQNRIGTEWEPGPPPPSYGVHKQAVAQKKTIYEMADEKANSNAPSDAASGSGMGFGSGSGSGSWTQPLPDAKGTCPVEQNWNESAAMEKAKVEGEHKIS